MLNTMDISMFKNIKELKINNNIEHTESQLLTAYLDKKHVLLKEIEATYIKYKLKTINYLNTYENDINIDEINFPIGVMTKNNQESAIIYEYKKNNINLKRLLKNSKLSLECKINLLKEIGLIVNKVHNVKCLKNKFFINDLHEANFIFNRDKGRIELVDIDGCKILDSDDNSGSKFLEMDDKINKLNKYKRNNIGIVIPDKNTDLFCYISVILNTLLNYDLYELTNSEFNDYLMFLNDNKFNKDILDLFEAIYTEKDNYFDIELLDSIPKDKNLTYKQFKKQR